MMHKPPSPGEFIREVCLKPLGLTVTQAAKDLGVSRKALSELLNGKSGISPEMALRLAKAFNTTPESWLTQQMHYDLWKVKQKTKTLNVQKLQKSTKQNLLTKAAHKQSLLASKYSNKDESIWEENTDDSDWK